MHWAILVILSAVFLSSVDVIRKRILKGEHSLELLTTSMIVIVVLQLFLLPFISLQISIYNLILTLTRSIIVAVAILFFTRAVKHMEISTIMPVKNITPLFLIFLSVVFLNETVTFFQILGIFLIVSGSYFLQIHNHYLDFFKHLKEMNNKYFYYALGGASLFAISAMLSKKVLLEVEPLTYIFYSNIFICAYYLANTFIFYDGIHDIKFGLKKGKYWIFITSIFAIISDIFYFQAIALPTAMISLIIPIKRLSTLFSVIVGGRMFHEHYLFHKILSTIVILMGVCFIVFA